MNPHNLGELVLDALYHHRTQKTDTCFPRNFAREELEQASAEALPVIEQVLKDVVVPNFSLPYDELYQPVPGFPGVQCRHPFLGLSHVLGAYLSIGSKYDAARVARFLHNMPTNLQAEAVRIVPAFFRNARIHPHQKVANDLKPQADEKIISYVEDTSKSMDERLREVGLATLSLIHS